MTSYVTIDNKPVERDSKLCDGNWIGMTGYVFQTSGAVVTSCVVTASSVVMTRGVMMTSGL